MSPTRPPARTPRRAPTRAAGRPAPRRAFRVSRRGVGWTIVGAFFGAVALFLIGYWTTTVPSPKSFSTAQTTIITYRDGRTQLGRIGSTNRIDVPLTQVPLAVQHAVLAAEDRNYYSEPGVSIKGILRALWADVRGGGVTQGGSTITQQYAKNAFLTQQRTITRKIREVFIAIKLDRTQSKDQILQDYLNTIYFGRGAYGIETASEAYFGLHVSQLDAAQGAVLAGLITAPSYYDPALHPTASRARWQYVIAGMKKQGWLSPAQAASISYPTVIAPRILDVYGGTNGYLVEAVKSELASLGYSESQLAAGGYRVVTTLDPTMQRAAVAAVRGVLGRAVEPVAGMAAVQPGTGEIRAMYGGQDFTGTQPAAQINLAENRRPVGSSFKPYTLATALSQGISLRTLYRGTSPLVVPGWNSPGHLVQNDSNEQCPRCDLVQATALSINTIYAQLVMQVGPANVAAMAHAAGITAPLHDRSGYVAPSITLGVYNVSPLEQADGFATFAAGGIHAVPHLVAEILDSSGHPVYLARPKLNRAFSPQVAADATYAMSQVVSYGTGTRAQLANGRPAAGKTGTTSNYTDAWFAGFTPQLSAAVWIGNVNDSPLTNFPGYPSGVYGGQLPAEIWKAFMDAALANTPVVGFPAPVFLGSTSRGLPPLPTASPTPSPSAASSPTPTPSARRPSPTPSLTSTPSRPPRPPSPTVSPSPSKTFPIPSPPSPARQ